MLQELDDTTKHLQRKWLIFMLERVGQNNLPRLLDYYESIGWISGGVAKKLIELADKEKRYKGPTWTLSAQEHGKSMIFIERISGRHIDKTFLNTHPGKAVLESDNIQKKKPRAGYLEGNRSKKGKMAYTIQRQEVTIKNLEQELEKKDTEIEKLGEKIHELEQELNETREKVKKNLIFRGLLEENIRLAKGSYRVHKTPARKM
jgi:archaellum component FlaD/FlaE